MNSKSELSQTWGSWIMGLVKGLINSNMKKLFFI